MIYASMEPSIILFWVFRILSNTYFWKSEGKMKFGRWNFHKSQRVILFPFSNHHSSFTFVFFYLMFRILNPLQLCIFYDTIPILTKLSILKNNASKQSWIFSKLHFQRLYFIIRTLIRYEVEYVNLYRTAIPLTTYFK